MLSIKEKKEIKKDIQKTIGLGDSHDYSKHSEWVYVGTDNLSEIKKRMLQFKKCLILTSSGEYAIDLAKEGAEVFTFDINKLSYYIQQLRIAGVTKLEYEEFITYFFGDGEKQILDEELYTKLREGLTEKAQIYFDSLYDYLGSIETFRKGFGIDPYQNIKRTFHYYMPIVQELFSIYKKEGFYQAKEIDLQKQIHFEQFDIMNFKTSPYHMEEDFDLIQFSNVIHFLTPKDRQQFYEQLETYYPQKLTENGILVNYFHSQTGVQRRYMLMDLFKNLSYTEERTRQLEKLSKISQENIDIGEGYNGYGIYQNDLINLIRKK